MAKNDVRKTVIMVCPTCGLELRPTSKNTRNTTGRLEKKMYCKNCKKNVLAKEKK